MQFDFMVTWPKYRTLSGLFNRELAAVAEPSVNDDFVVTDNSGGSHNDIAFPWKNRRVKDFRYNVVLDSVLSAMLLW